MPLNLNGRICVFFSLFWGFLGIYLISYANPRIDKMINFFKNKISIWILKTFIIVINCLLILDCLITMFALGLFFTRIVYKNDLNVANRDIINIEYEKFYSDEKKVSFINRFFGDEKMLKTFPNLKLQDVDGNIIYFRDLLPNIQPYYFKLNSYLRGDLVHILKHDNSINSIKQRIEQNFEVISKGEV